MPTTNEVLIQFIPDTTQLESAEQRLLEMGKIDQKSAVIFKATNDQLVKRETIVDKVAAATKKEQAVVNKLVASLKTLSGESKKAVESLLKLSTDEIVAGFDKAAVSVEDYVDALKVAEEQPPLPAPIAPDSEEKVVSLRAQLKGMIAELARLKLAGEDQTEAYSKLAAQAGELSDTLGDVKSEIEGLGSDTSTFDGLIEGAQGLAAGFSVVQGAAGLFGADTEALQETLVKVNSSMAILQGLQQIAALTQKESALSLFALNVQRKIQNAEIVVENALQSKSVIVRGLATVAQKALNLAMSVNPIGLVITALVALTGAIAFFTREADDATNSLEQLNREFENGIEINERYEAELLKRGDTRVAQAELENKSAKDIRAIRSQTLQEQLKGIDELRAKNESAYNQARDLQRANVLQGKKISDEEQVALEKTIENFEALDTKRYDLLHKINLKTIEDNKATQQEILEDTVSAKQAELDRIQSVGGRNTGSEFNARKALLRAQAVVEINDAAQNSAKILAINMKLKNDLRQVDLDSREQRQKDSLANLESQLVKEQNLSREINERESQKEIDLRKKIILETARFESEADGLSAQQRTAIKLKGIQEAAQLQKDFNKKTTQESLQDQISINEAALARVEIDEKDKLNLKIENIIAAAAIEEDNNKGLSAKIKEINAKRDADIRSARLQSIQDTLAFELRENEAANAAQLRNTEKILTAQDALRSAPNNTARKFLEQQLGIRRITLEQEASLVNEQTEIQLEGIRLQKHALRQSLIQDLISRKDYNLSLSELTNQEVEAVENGEERKRKAANDTLEHQKNLDKQRVDLAIDIANQVSGVAAGFSDLQTQQANLRISAERARIDELKAAGAITEKDAILRLKKIDAEEARIKYAAAVRDKQLAIFNAVIATAAGVAKASPVIPLMILAGALGAAQVALITARPIPKFAKGKKDRYQGLGEVGEDGSELIESNGQMFIAKKPTIIWLGAKDKVYNPKETKAILDRQLPTINNKVMMSQEKLNIDYEKLGKAIGKHSSSTTTTKLSIDGYKSFIQEQNSFTTYLNNRRGY